ncbi:MAG: hypothetical protein LBR56_07555 [Sporomusaceae bacterium]|jgi:hypothetical protein|nr:hypothetical protein [Sporomusaceae bacterium]
MALKITLYLAAFTSVLTVIFSLLHSVRVNIAFYRGIFTFALFAALGYLISFAIGLYRKKMLANKNVKGTKIDIIDEQKENLFSAATPPTAEAAKPVPEFKPLTPDDLTDFSATKK